VPRPRTRGVLFDKDGTLLDYFPTWLPINRAAALAAAGGDLALSHLLLRAAGHDPDTDRVQAGTALVAGTAEDVARLWLPLVGGALGTLTETLDAVFTAEARRHAVAVPGLRAALEAQRAAGRALGVATSDSAAACRATLEALDVVALFSFTCGWDSGHGTKPGPGMVHAFCRATGIPAAEVAVVGDSLHDLHMGRAAGAGRCIAVLTGPATRAELAPHADAVIRDLRDLADVLGP
jgi:phosphoglycolate phosphatase